MAMTASCRLQHLAMDIIGLLHGFETFCEAARALAGPPKATFCLTGV